MDALSPGLRREIQKQKQAYDLGQYGPDPLFFYHPECRTRTARLGTRMHRTSMIYMIPKLHRALEEQPEYAFSYCAGFICHFALDSRCHAYVYRISRTTVHHTAIELEFDRFLMERQGLDPAHCTPLAEVDLPQSFYRMLADCFYPGIEKHGFEKGLSAYEHLCRLHTKCAAFGTRPVGSLLVPREEAERATIRNLTMKHPPGGTYDRYNRFLLRLLEGEVARTAEELELFFQGEQPSSWYHRDFHGGIDAKNGEE